MNNIKQETKMTRKTQPPLSEELKTIKNNIFECIEEIGMNQKDLAIELGITQQLISAWIHCNASWPSILYCIKLSKASYWEIDPRSLSNSLDWELIDEYNGMFK